MIDEHHENFITSTVRIWSFIKHPSVSGSKAVVKYYLIRLKIKNIEFC
ncbi:hypothetical protein B4168_1597 [Anoxybacillus flavithermus]|nr:hypothetical protein B4168_1597 [Anoxybacillus flavithermus]OAO84251.1 hypothetical protein GT23_3786 [Parageobacillus thermoglucosidasius]